MQLKRTRSLAAVCAAVLLTALALTWPALARADEPEARGKDLSGLISSFTMTAGGEDRIGNTEEAAAELGSLMFNVSLSNSDGTLKIAKGDQLSVKIKPVDAEKSFLTMNYQMSIKDRLVDEAQDIEIAKANLSSRAGFVLTFNEISDPFTASINMPFELDSEALRKYFDSHPGEETVTFAYQVYVDDRAQEGQVAYFKADKPNDEVTSDRFVKSSGTYNQVGDFGEGRFLFNVKVATMLNQYNEFVIYDTPDVNLAFNGDMKVVIPRGYGGVDWEYIRLHSGENTYIEREDANEDTRMEIYLYDVYFLTDEAEDIETPRQAGWEDATLSFDRKNQWTGEPYTQSAQKAAVPKNILVEKLAGEELTAEEQKKIDEAGGLNKTVGKGFKVRIKNFKGAGFAEGGYLTLVYYCDIVNASPDMDKQGLPRYYNTASLYAQEIPNCNKPGDASCVPIKVEKTDLGAIIEGDYTSDPIVDPSKGEIGGTVDRLSALDFTKKGRAADASDEEAAPLAGAVFTVYHANANGSRGSIAESKEGKPLENLVTNAQGKLCFPAGDGSAGMEADLHLERGNYLFAEVKAPGGYKPAEDDVLVTVGLANNIVTVVNVAEGGGAGPDPEPEPETILPQAQGLVAYEGGRGSHGSKDTGDALPEPVWRAQWEGWSITVDGEPWDTDEKGMPFRWGYFAEGDTDPEDVLTEAAGKGVYALRAWALEGEPEVTAEDKNGKEYQLGLSTDETVAIRDPQGEPVAMRVRDVTDDEHATGLVDATFRPVFDTAPTRGEVAPTLARALAAGYGTAIDGSFDENGTQAGSCESSDEPHAHVAAGTAFYKNGHGELPVNEGAKISLLWDELLQDVLGGEAREGALDTKARAAAGGSFATRDDVQRAFRYMDLVDMEDGNVWVGTASEPTTVFWPYPAGVDASTELAVVRFPGLTRDYTIDADAAELDAAIGACEAEALALKKTDAGVMFEVPSCGFGPFELMWLADDDGGDPEPDPSPKPDQQPGDGSGEGPGGKPTGGLPQTGDLLPLALAVSAVVGAAVLGAGAFLRRSR